MPWLFLYLVLGCLSPGILTLVGPLLGKETVHWPCTVSRTASWTQDQRLEPLGWADFSLPGKDSGWAVQGCSRTNMAYEYARSLQFTYWIYKHLIRECLWQTASGQDCCCRCHCSGGRRRQLRVFGGGKLN